MYTYRAEFISKVGNTHYLNIDLGFNKWEVIPMELDPYDYKFGDKLVIQVIQTSRRPYKYRGDIIEWLE